MSWEWKKSPKVAPWAYEYRSNKDNLSVYVYSSGNSSLYFGTIISVDLKFKSQDEAMQEIEKACS